MAKRSENQGLFNLETPAKLQGPVECLGMTFENDEARWEHFPGRLRFGLEELHAKLGGVPFTAVEDAVARRKSLKMAGWLRSANPRTAGRMGQAARHRPRYRLTSLAAVRQIGRAAYLDAPKVRPKGEGQGSSGLKTEETNNGGALGRSSPAKERRATGQDPRMPHGVR